MEKIICKTFNTGRRFVGRLPHHKDLLRSVENFCKEAAVQMAAFSVIGAVSSFTIGSYDQKQQVYVTFAENSAREIAACTGNVSLKDGNPAAHAHIVLSNEQGDLIGGHLFSETLIFAGEIDIQELTGTPYERAYDNTTGLMLWNL
jgi:predicted DNA-binding protein with PD1-like motif